MIFILCGVNKDSTLFWAIKTESVIISIIMTFILFIYIISSKYVEKYFICKIHPQSIIIINPEKSQENKILDFLKHYLWILLDFIFVTLFGTIMFS